MADQITERGENFYATNHAQLLRKILSPMPDFCEKVFEKRFQVTGGVLIIYS
jgi:hypothetical protein